MDLFPRYTVPDRHSRMQDQTPFLRGGTEPEPAERLTPREREIVRLLAGGKSNKEVAVELDISVKTVEAHRANIMHKLNLGSFSDLVHYAIRQKIVEA